MDREKGEYDFYLRYNISHKGKYGFEFLEFEFMPNGRLRYGNNSNYKGDGLIRKEVYITPIVLEELQKLIRDSKILSQDDSKWPKPEEDRKQELEIIQDNKHISFITSKITSSLEIRQSKDPRGLEIFYFFVQDLKSFLFTLMSMHFRIKPVQK